MLWVVKSLLPEFQMDIQTIAMDHGSSLVYLFSSLNTFSELLCHIHVLNTAKHYSLGVCFTKLVCEA